MTRYEWLLLAVGINWGGLLLLFVYPLAMLAWKDFVFDGWYGPFMKFRLATKKDTDDPIEPWHAKLWKDWWGVSLGFFMCYRYPNERGEKHEGTHCWQWLILGLVVFWLSYQTHMLWIFCSQRIRWWWIKATRERALGQDDRWMRILSQENPLGGKCVAVYEDSPYTKHAYLDCWAERMARKRAGQLVDVPPSQWPQGSKDLWPWW